MFGPISPLWRDKSREKVHKNAIYRRPNTRKPVPKLLNSLILSWEADCFDIKTADVEGSACFSVVDNVLLEIEFEDKGIGHGMLKATEYATGISGDVFEPLFPVLEPSTGNSVPGGVEEGPDGDEDAPVPAR